MSAMIMNGNAPTLISGVPKLASSEATIRSHASAIPRAPARTWPRTTHRVGLPRSPISLNRPTKRSEPKCLCTSGTSAAKPPRDGGTTPHEGDKPEMAATAESVLKPDFAAARKHFIFNDEHEQLRESITNFATKELAPHADEWEETTFPDWVFNRMGELGFLGLDKPEQYGGQGGDYYSAMVLGEAIGAANCGGLAMGVAVQTDMAMPPILAFGTEEQKQEWVVPAIRGEKILCLGITEPDAGSDVKGIKTRAVRDGDDFVI